MKQREEIWLSQTGHMAIKYSPEKICKKGTLTVINIYAFHTVTIITRKPLRVT